MIIEYFPIVLLSAYVLDLIFGDPQWFPHPVRLMGKLIRLLENFFRSLSTSPPWLKFSGILLAFIVCASTFGITSLAIHLAGLFFWVAGLICSIFFAFTALSIRDLHVETRKVLLALENGDLTLARKELSYIVGRDTAHLDQLAILRALVETIAENISDGVIAPFFYLGLGGSSWAMTYKAVNTLDSMVGYKNERYRHIGWASARMDDAANFIPARLSGLIIVLSSLFLRKPWMDSWRILRRDRGKHESPNSAWPEAAMAGALGVRLGGLNFYFGQPSQKPFIGDPKKEIDLADVREAWKILYLASLWMLLFSLFLAWAVGAIFNLR